MFEVTFVEYFGAKWNWELLSCQIFVEIKQISKENPFEKLLMYQLWIFCLNWPLPSIILFTLPWVLLWGSSLYAKTHFVCSVNLLTWPYHRLESIYFYRRTHNGFRDRIFVHTTCLYRVQCRNMRICLHIGEAGFFSYNTTEFHLFHFLSPASIMFQKAYTKKYLSCKFHHQHLFLWELHPWSILPIFSKI